MSKRTAYEYFAAWRDIGVWQEILDMLRGAVRCVEPDRQELDPNAAGIDSQMVKMTELGGERGSDEGKKITAHKRNIAVDTLVLLLAVVVTSAGVDDAAPEVFKQPTRN